MRKIKIEKIGDHSIKKFELISNYARQWAIKLLNYPNCKKIVFIDCMSNCGHYYDSNSTIIEGTAVRVAKLLKPLSFEYPNKQIELIFNDIDGEKIDYLRNLLPISTDNFHISLYKEDANNLLKIIKFEDKTCYLLIYDPFEASINWNSIVGFLNSWSEVIVNHMVSDPLRAIKTVKREKTINKYKDTYLTETFEELLRFSNKEDYEDRIEQIINILSNKKKNVFVAAFPFFNEKNTVVYNLIQCTNNLEGFKLFKKTAWNTFDGKSSSKNTKGKEDQLMLDFDQKGYNPSMADENCYYIKDVADYIQTKFDSRKDVPLKEIWDLLDKHPVFPSDGYKSEIKNELKKRHGTLFSKTFATFSHRTK